METWRTILPNYEVSSLGRVRNIKRGSLVKPRADYHGYLTVTLRENKTPTHRYVHRLVSQAFISPRIKGMHVNHKDGNKVNNDLSNLEYISHGDNVRHAYSIGLMAVGSRVHCSKLKEAQVEEIRSLKGSTSGCSLAQRFQVSSATISMILSGRTWKHVRGVA